jgi:cell division transport system ATP-binding protein
VIKLTSVSKEYPRRGFALRDVSFHLKKGEFAFLTGHSGSGKSTTMRLVHMSERPTKGEVRVTGFTSEKVTRRHLWKVRRRVGFVFQDFRLLPGRTALENELSGGQQQRVAIARALANDPYVLLADEPTGNLDERATRGVLDLFWDINAKGMAVLMATHDLELVRRYPHARVFELDHGHLVYDSAAEAPAVSEG